GANSTAIDKSFLVDVERDLLPNGPSSPDDFRKGGYYVIPHPNKNVKNHDFVVLSIFWSSSYKNIRWAPKYTAKCGPKSYTNTCDPSDDTPEGVQLCWLDHTLQSEQQAGRKVTLVMHIPPGIDEFKHDDPEHDKLWADGYAEKFTSLVVKYKDM